MMKWRADEDGGTFSQRTGKRVFFLGFCSPAAAGVKNRRAPSMWEGGVLGFFFFIITPHVSLRSQLGRIIEDLNRSLIKGETLQRCKWSNEYDNQTWHIHVERGWRYSPENT